MARHVHSGEMVFHVWAQGPENRTYEGRRTDGRVFFERRTLYSYGRHFALGYIMPDGVALLNSDSYSVSTGRHQSQTRQAIAGAYRNVPDLTALIPALDTLEQGRTHPSRERGRELLRAGKRGIRAHVAKHALELKPETGEYLLELTGQFGRQFVEVRAKAERAAERAKAKADREAHAWALDEARLIAGASMGTLLQHVRQSEFSLTWDNRRVLGELPLLLERLQRAHKAAKREGWGKKRVAHIWAALKAARARKARILANVAHAGDRKSLRSEIRAVRALVSDLQDYLDRDPRPESFPPMGTRLHAVQSILERFPWLLSRPLGRLQETYETARREHDATQRERESKLFAQWRGGAPIRCPGSFRETPNRGAHLRAVGIERDDSGTITGGTLETSQGATVPLAHALKAFRFIKAVRAKGEPWQRNGHTVRVGHFQLDRIDANGDFKAGCHFIEWAEVERLAERLGVAGLAPSSEALEARAHA